MNKKNHFLSAEPSLIDNKKLIKWVRQRKIIPPKVGYKRFALSLVKSPDFSIKHDAVWWLGHATTLIQIEGKTILTDPVFSNRASPVQFAGPKRRTPKPCDIQALPQIDIVVISHNHYDHLDYPSIRKILKYHPSVTLVVPLGLKILMQKWGAKKVFELDWWQDIVLDKVTITSIPAKHWSRRTALDTNASLWCGWVIQSCHKQICFLGDTAYSDVFKTIKQRFTIDLALIPIGAYAPRWFMRNQHIDPEQATQIFNDIGCKKALAIHWGVFELADEPLDEPPELLKSLLPAANIDEQDFVTINIGEYVAIN